MDPILNLIQRNKNLFFKDIKNNEKQITDIVNNSSFLVIGGAGSIGQAVTKEIFKRNPKLLHVVDINENNMAELVRDIRSSFGYIKGEFETYILDIGSIEFNFYFQNKKKFDYILNLSALKHVRSEKDPYTLMRMININIINTNKNIKQAIEAGTRKYFCVSTDKAANPVNIMGASKRIMEMFLMKNSSKIDISTARFANVAFSDGSLLNSFQKRIEKRQPIVTPNDIFRYFITPQESGELCLMSCILGENRDIFFPKLNKEMHLINFADIAIRYLGTKGYKPYFCNSEKEARKLVKTLPQNGEWPILFSRSDTTGEKAFEEFYTNHETKDMERFIDIGIIKSKLDYSETKLSNFEKNINKIKKELSWQRKDLIKIFKDILPNFEHKETGKYLDNKM